jgi:hypothetical protein
MSAFNAAGYLIAGQPAGQPAMRPARELPDEGIIVMD